MRPRIRDDLDRDVRAAGHRYQVHKLLAHHGWAADLAVECALIDQRAHHRGRRVIAFQDRLPGQPSRQPLADDVLGDIGVGLQDRPRVGLGLEQARDQAVLEDVQRCRVGLDYHVEIAKHYYSVPHSLVHQEVETRITQKTVEIFLRGKRVASHLRSTLPHRPTTISEHMPSSHRRYRDWTHERIRSEAAKVGPDADTLIDVILRSRPHPEQGFRSAIGILGLVKRYGQERVDAACARALLLNARSYKSVAAILKNGTDRTAPPAEEAPILFHANIRGRSYYN